MCTVDHVQKICFLIDYCSLLKISVSLINIALTLHGFTDLVCSLNDSDVFFGINL